MHPIRLEVVNAENDRADRPCDGIGGEDDGDVPECSDHDGDIRHAQQTPRCEHDHHRDHCLTRTAQNACHAVVERE